MSEGGDLSSPADEPAPEVFAMFRVVCVIPRFRFETQLRLMMLMMLLRLLRDPDER